MKLHSSAPQRGRVRRQTFGLLPFVVIFGFLTTAPADARISAAAVGPAPANVELLAGGDSSITISWSAVLGATGYKIYRGTGAGGEGNTAIVSTTATRYKDPNLSPTPVYFYQVTAVTAAGESARTAEDASKTPPPVGTGGGVAGVPTGNGRVYYGRDALLGGFDWFQALSGWFPQVLGVPGSVAPTNARVVDMAYSTRGTMTFNKVTVPTAGLYSVDWRYAFASGLFPGVNNRHMGLRVNGTVITRTLRFPITGSFTGYQHSILQVRLKAGTNSVALFAVSDHGVPRLDQLTVWPATAAAPSGPTRLTATRGNASVRLTWAASATGRPTAYRVYRGTKSDGEANTPVGTTTGTTFTNTGLRNGTRYFYVVAAINAAGVSPDTNEASAIPAA